MWRVFSVIPCGQLISCSDQITKNSFFCLHRRISVQASDIASRMAENVRDEPWVLEDGQEMQVEIDVGVAVQSLDGLSWEEVLATARSRIGSHRVHTAETPRTIH